MKNRAMIDLYRGEDQVFRIGDQKTFSWDSALLPEGGIPSDYNFRLFVKGEPSVDAAMLSEWGGGLFLRDIDDSLSDITHHSQYSLRFRATSEPAERRAYYKMLCNPPTYPGGLHVAHLPSDGIWQFSFYTKGVDFCPLGEAEVRAEIFYAKQDRVPQDILDDADEILRFPIKSGTYDFCKTEGEIRIDEHIAAILFTVSVGASTGELFVEDVALKGVTDLSLIPRFHPSSPYSTTLNWFGENLSHHEWSDFELSVNGKCAGKRSFFSSIYRYNENEFPIDSSLFEAGENTLTLRYVSDYFHPAPFKIIRLSLLVEKKHPFHIVACPHTATLGERLAVVLESENDDLTLSVKTDSGLILPIEDEVRLEEAGLHAVLFDVKGMTGACEITLTANGYTESCNIARTVRRGNDGVLCGSGDDVYIAQTEDAKREYIKWYLANECGNFITFRPTYHWSSSRSLSPVVWKKTIPLLNKIGMHYCLLFDEREIPGLNANPTKDLLAGPYFMGYQGHERDGCYYYWGNDMWNCNGHFYWELRDRILRHPDVSYRVPPQYAGTKTYTYRAANAVKTVREAMALFEERLAYTLRGFKRHTGVTLLFRHFIRAGIEVPGAETMYANHEIPLSGLRGTAYAYSKSETAAHLALQWYVDAVGRGGFANRYALSLAVSYLHGVSHINTEEGLWRMENGFESHDRFSPACQSNQAIKRKFLRFVQSHTREGLPVHRHGILYGNGECTVSNFIPAVWGREELGWERGAPEESWELIRTFYPNATTHRIPNVETDRERGWFSCTPYGLCDIIPVEAPDEKLNVYPYLAFLGYHLATEELTEHLRAYVEQGGKLLLCLCQLSTDDERPRIKEPDFGTHLVNGYETLTGFAVRDIRYNGYRRADADWSGVTVKTRHENGEPLVVEHSLGLGKVITVNSFEYPVHEAIRQAYSAELRALANAVKAEDAERGDIDIGDQPIQYAIYELPNGRRRIYLLNVDWYSRETVAKAALTLAGKRYELSVLRGEIGIVDVFGDVATYTCDPSTEVLGLQKTEKGISLRLQGEGESALWLLECGKTTEVKTSLCGEAEQNL